MSATLSVHGRRVGITDHARRQYRHRTPDGAVSIDDALAQSVPAHDAACPLFRTGDHRCPDAVRLVAGTVDGQRYGVVFLLADAYVDPVVVTAYRIQSRWDPSLRAYCWARLAAEADST